MTSGIKIFLGSIMSALVKKAQNKLVRKLEGLPKFKQLKALPLDRYKS
jgi:hypothetical protein